VLFRSLAPGFESLEWFGRGPHECYPDRARGALLARHRSTVTEQYVPYVMPQEHGLHVDTRWVSLGNPAMGVTVAAVFAGSGAFSASHLTAGDLTAATHDVDLSPRAETVLHLDHRHRGLGSLSCGPDTLAQYRMGSGTYRWRWSLQLLRSAR